MLLRCNTKPRLAAIALLLGALAGSPAVAGSAYLQEVTDMPLPAGFSEDVAAGMAFDKPEGRIVEAVATGRGRAGDVVGFYRTTLPQLGWTALGRPEALTWRREGEALRLDIAESDAGIAIRFHIAPQ